MRTPGLAAMHAPGHAPTPTGRGRTRIRRGADRCGVSPPVGPGGGCRQGRPPRKCGRRRRRRAPPRRGHPERPTSRRSRRPPTPDRASSARVEGDRMRIRYRRSAQKHTSTRVIDPYGLVAKSGRWYLVADDRGAGRLFSVERLSAFETLDVPATLRPGQTLRTRWEALKERTEATGRVSVTARLRES